MGRFRTHIRQAWGRGHSYDSPAPSNASKSSTATSNRSRLSSSTRRARPARHSCISNGDRQLRHLALLVLPGDEQRNHTKEAKWLPSVYASLQLKGRRLPIGGESNPALLYSTLDTIQRCGIFSSRLFNPGVVANISTCALLHSMFNPRPRVLFRCRPFQDLLVGPHRHAR